METAHTEDLLQELHATKNKLDLLKKVNNDLLSMELEYNALDCKYKEMEANMEKVLRSKEKLEQKIESLSTALEAAHSENLTLTEKLAEVTNQVNVEPVPVALPCQCLNSSYFQSKELKIQDLENIIKSLESEKEEMNKFCSEIQTNYQSTASQLEEFTTLYEAKREELQSCQQIIEGLTEDKVLLEAEIRILKVPNVDLDQRGNSLFAEVEDKRRSMAKNLEAVMLKYKKVSQQLNSCQVELRKLKDENINLRNEVSSDRVRLAEAKRMEAYKVRIEDLEKAVAVYSERPESPVILTVDVPDLSMVSAMLERARSETNSLRIELLRKSQSESEHATKTYVAERQLRLSLASLDAKEKEIENLKGLLKEQKELIEKYKADLESEGKENGCPSDGNRENKKSIKFVRFNSDFQNRMQDDTMIKPKIVKQPKCVNMPMTFVKAGPVVEVSTELKKKVPESMKKAE